MSVSEISKAKSSCSCWSGLHLGVFSTLQQGATSEQNHLFWQVYEQTLRNWFLHCHCDMCLELPKHLWKAPQLSTFLSVSAWLLDHKRFNWTRLCDCKLYQCLQHHQDIITKLKEHKTCKKRTEQCMHLHLHIKSRVYWSPCIKQSPCSCSGRHWAARKGLVISAKHLWSVYVLPSCTNFTKHRKYDSRRGLLN